MTSQPARSGEMPPRRNGNNSSSGAANVGASNAGPTTFFPQTVSWLVTRSPLRWVLASLAVVVLTVFAVQYSSDVPLVGSSLLAAGTSSTTRSHGSSLLRRTPTAPLNQHSQQQDTEEEKVEDTKIPAAIGSVDDDVFDLPPLDVATSKGSLSNTDTTTSILSPSTYPPPLYPIGVSSKLASMMGAGAFLKSSDGIKATLTEETLHGFDASRNRRTPQEKEALVQKYCGECRQYIGTVPDSGARVGHFLYHTELSFHAAFALNLTLLYHPILPNQIERYLFDGVFGYGVDEPFRYRETCLTGQVGKTCREYLPCLTIKSFSALGAKSEEFMKNFEADRNSCNLVYMDPHLIPRALVDAYPEIEHRLREKYKRARALAPIASSFDPSFFHVVIHIRRGDVSTTKNPSRYTSNEAYVKLIGLMRLAIAEVVTKPVRFNIFSEGNKDKDFADLAALPDIDFSLSKSLVWTIHHQVIADILVVSRSGFSGMCGRLRDPEKVTMYAEGFAQSHSRRVFPWIPFNNDRGTFNAEHFKKVLAKSIAVS